MRGVVGRRPPHLAELEVPPLVRAEADVAHLDAPLAKSVHPGLAPDLLAVNHPADVAQAQVKLAAGL
eukprot:3859189-Pleurochrysis_carterae.AAC.1